MNLYASNNKAWKIGKMFGTVGRNAQIYNYNERI